MALFIYVILPELGLSLRNDVGNIYLLDCVIFLLLKNRLWYDLCYFSCAAALRLSRFALASRRISAAMAVMIAGSSVSSPSCFAR